MLSDRVYSPGEGDRSFPLDTLWNGLKRGLRRALGREVRRPQHDDLIQEAWARVFRALQSTPPDASTPAQLSSWATRVGYRAAIDWMRHDAVVRRITRAADSAEDEDGDEVTSRLAVAHEPDPLERLIALEGMARRNDDSDLARLVREHGL